jgi:glycosyltransferase involved in cell wall biosynthesis
MVRLVHLTGGNLYGGIESLLVTLARIGSEAPRKLEQAFVLAFEGRFASELRRLGATVRIVGPARLLSPLTVRSARRKTRDFLRETGPTAVLAHDTWPLAVLGPAASEYPLFFYQHMPASGSLLEQLARRQKVKGVLSTSEFIAGTSARIFPDVPVTVARPAVISARPVDRVAVRRQLGADADDLVILQVSRFERWKGHLLHLAALKKLATKRRWRLWIAGGAIRPSEHQLRSEIEAIAAEFPKGRIQLLGERDDIPLLMGAADIFCQPNTDPEPFGLVFVEALAAGLPVVTTRMGGALEIVDDSVGVMVSASEDELAAALNALVEDDAFRTRLARRASARAGSLCDPEASLAALLEAVEPSLDAGRQGRTWV